MKVTPPRTTHITFKEGGLWIPFEQGYKHYGSIHSIRFSDGSEWDCINGWRTDENKEYKE